MIMRKQMSHGLVAHFTALNAIKHSPFDFFFDKKLKNIWFFIEK